LIFGEKMNRTIGIIGMSAVLLAVMAGLVGATGQNQYGTGFPASCNGVIHGAFANINGNFGIIGHEHVSQASTGDNNADAAAYCNSLT
jgi:hypothetical protein